MKTIKRWTSTLVTSFDSVMKQVENHEAIIASSIKETQVAAAKAKVRYNRLIADGQSMERRLCELRKSEVQWADRAVKMHYSDKDKALECIRRRNRSRIEAEHLEGEIKEHKQIEKKLCADLRTIEQRIEELRIKRNNFSAREYRAQAMQASNPGALADPLEMEDIFERWEIKLAENEVTTACSSDVLENEFRESEELIDVESDLEDLLSERKEDSEQ